MSLGTSVDPLNHTVASGAIWTPLDVLKSRLQKGNEGTTSALTLSRKIIREEGVKGLFRGYMLGNFLYVPNISVYWMTYESLKTRFIPGYSSLDPKRSTTPTAANANEKLGGVPLTARYTLCSVASCCVAACSTNGIEVVQARWQTSGGHVKGGVMAIVKELWSQGGAMAFSRGLGVRIAYAVEFFLFCSPPLSPDSEFRQDLPVKTDPFRPRSVDSSKRYQHDCLRIAQAMEGHLNGPCHPHPSSSLFKAVDTTRRSQLSTPPPPEFAHTETQFRPCCYTI